MKTTKHPDKVLLLAALFAIGTGSALSQAASNDQSSQMNRNSSSDRNQTATDNATTNSSGTDTAIGITTVTPMFVMFPPEVIVTDSVYRHGCWARIYDHNKFNGDSLTLIGPNSISDMSGPYGLNWDDRVHSIVVGPKTTVTVFDNKNYHDQVAQFTPGQKVADLSKRMGFFDDFGSIKLDCAKS